MRKFHPLPCYKVMELRYSKNLLDASEKLNKEVTVVSKEEFIAFMNETSLSKLNQKPEKKKVAKSENDEKVNSNKRKIDYETQEECAEECLSTLLFIIGHYRKRKRMKIKSTLEEYEQSMENISKLADKLLQKYEDKINITPIYTEGLNFLNI